MKKSIKLSHSETEILKKCDRIICGNEHFSRPSQTMRAEVVVVFGDNRKSEWPALTSAPNQLYRMLKSVDGVIKVKVEIVA